MGNNCNECWEFERFILYDKISFVIVDDKYKSGMVKEKVFWMCKKKWK